MTSSHATSAEPESSLAALALPVSTEAPQVGAACRSILRAYRTAIAAEPRSAASWRGVVEAALAYLGGQGDRSARSLRDYDSGRYGPFLAISNEGGGASIIRAIAAASPKARALGRCADPYTLGVAIDGERLGGVGEVPVGPGEFGQIWFEAVDRLLMTTNIGSRANLRFYLRPQIVTAGDDADAETKALADLSAAVAPFLAAPGGPRPVVVYLDPGATRTEANAVQLLKAVAGAGAAAGDLRPGVSELGVYARIAAGDAGRDQALRAVRIAADARLTRVILDGAVRPEADAPLSLPGLLDYLTPDALGAVLDAAGTCGVSVATANRADPDTVARQIWSALNTARGMGWDLGKYSLLPLTLADSEAVVAQMQGWFADWSAAPVFYADQGLLTAGGLFAGARLEDGVVAWLQMIARHGVAVALIDTVDKAQGWKLVKTGADPKGLLTLDQIGRLDALGKQLGVNVMWAGGLEPADVFALGRFGVFGVYVTTAVCDPAPVTGAAYGRDPGLVALKRPDPAKALQVKTLLEAGFLLSGGVQLPEDLRKQVEAAGQNVAQLGALLPKAWNAWWTALGTPP